MAVHEGRSPSVATHKSNDHQAVDAHNLKGNWVRQRGDRQCERRYARVTEESSDLLMGLKGTQLAGFKLRG